MSNKAFNDLRSDRLEWILTNRMRSDVTSSIDVVRDFVRLNLLYCDEHWICQKDIDRWISARDYLEKVNAYKSVELTATGRVDGDSKTYSNALVIPNFYSDGERCICTQPYTPFMSLNNDMKTWSIHEPSGGYFMNMKEDDVLIPAGKKLCTYSPWGRHGMRANGALTVQAMVHHYTLTSDTFY